MRTCPRGGEEVVPGADSCRACGAPLAPARRLRRSLLAAGALVAIIVGAALLHTYLRSKVVRPPLEFVPASARAVVDLDLRPGTPPGARLARTWSARDRKALADRACDLAQQMVDLAGLELDVRKDAARWFGGEVLAVSVGGPDARSFTPGSFVLIARATNLRRARRDLDRSVEELARQGGWQRTTVRPEGRSVIVWGTASGGPEIAYAVMDGCLLVSASPELIGACLKAAHSQSQRLSDTAGFTRVRGRIPGDAFVWCYLSAGDALEAAREILPAIAQGWPGLVGRLQAMRRAAQIPRQPSASGGSIAVAIRPETDGLRLQASYLGITGKIAEGAPAGDTRLLELVPREVVAFAFVRDLPAMLGVSGKANRPLTARQRRAALLHRGPLHLMPPPEAWPQSLLVTVLPRPGAARPAAAAVFAGGGAQRTSEWLSKLAPAAKAATISGSRALATDDRALQQLEAAARDSKGRLEMRTGADVGLRVWARPAALSPALARLDEVDLMLRRNPTGPEVDVSVRAEPRYLLGGR